MLFSLACLLFWTAASSEHCWNSKSRLLSILKRPTDALSAQLGAAKNCPCNNAPNKKIATESSEYCWPSQPKLKKNVPSVIVRLYFLGYCKTSLLVHSSRNRQIFVWRIRNLVKSRGTNKSASRGGHWPQFQFANSWEQLDMKGSIFCTRSSCFNISTRSEKLVIVIFVKNITLYSKSFWVCPEWVWSDVVINSFIFLLTCYRPKHSFYINLER